MLVFVASEIEARAVATPLRNVLWGDHRMSVLLPSGEEPIKARCDPHEDCATSISQAED